MHLRALQRPARAAPGRKQTAFVVLRLRSVGAETGRGRKRGRVVRGFRENPEDQPEDGRSLESHILLEMLLEESVFLSPQ